MDESVLAAMTRWPDVPAVYGWLSLSEQGRWRLHPAGNAWQPNQPCEAPFSPGEPIENAQICSFMARNYASDKQGRWYFQNGPQRVYVRLDAAPYILHTDSTTPTLRTHNGLAVTEIASWWLDDDGRLYALTEHGPGLVSGRDMSVVLDALCTHDGTPLLEALELLDAESPTEPTGQEVTLDSAPRPSMRVRFQTKDQPSSTSAVEAELHFCEANAVASALGFIRCPSP